MQPAITDIQVSWHLPEGYDVLQTPEQVPQVFHGKRMALYGILSRSSSEPNRESPRSTKLRRINWSKRSFSSSSVKVFWFDDDLEYLPDEQRLQDLHESEATDEESDGYDYFACSCDSGTFLKIFDILTMLHYFFEGTAVNTWLLATAC